MNFPSCPHHGRFKLSNRAAHKIIIFTYRSFIGHAKSPNTGPHDTEEVLKLLLPASNMTIPPKSTCGGEYGQIGPPKVKDLLAMELAGFNRGNNAIVGSCRGTEARSCSLLIRHEFGEDGYSAEIHFIVNSKGVIDISTLTCIITP
jgi:hypothetical protein